MTQQQIRTQNANISSTQWPEKNKRLKLGKIEYAQTNPLTHGTCVRVRSGIDGIRRKGRVVSFPELNVVRVRYPYGGEELVEYPHSMHFTDENLDYSQIGLAQDVDSIFQVKLW